MKTVFSKIFQEFIPLLKKSGMSDNDINTLERNIKSKMEEEEPPKIAWVGLCGVGKSSTINALFNAGQEINHVVACTKEAKEIYSDVSKYIGSKGKEIIVYDMPGLGEDIEEDIKHLESYAKVLPKVDVVVWTISAGDRKMGPEQEALLKLKNNFGNKFTDRLVVVVNKADIIAPGETEWNKTLNMPSLEQMSNLEEFEEYVRKKIKKVLPDWKGGLVTYSAKYAFRLGILMNTIMEAVPIKRRWVYGQCTDVADFTQFIDPQYREYIDELMKK